MAMDGWSTFTLATRYNGRAALAEISVRRQSPCVLDIKRASLFLPHGDGHISLY